MKAFDGSLQDLRTRAGRATAASTPGDIYKERHAVAKKLSLARTIDWRIRPILERFGDWALTDIKPPTSKTSSPIFVSRASSASAPRSGA
ncbi:MAG: hypothetical protein LC804_03145 [Acidobacteria bacterium]|nr:hypothetical protein [Acidobacteriota bacterium]